MEVAGLTDIDWEAQAETIISQVMAFYNAIIQELAHGTYQPRIALPFSQDKTTVTTLCGYSQDTCNNPL